VDLVYALTHLSIETRALLAILTGALLLRILPLGAFSTEYDEGVYWLTMRAMADGHPLYTSIYNAQAPFFFPSLYPFFHLFGQTIIGTRFAVALYSLAGVVAAYLIGKGLGGRYVGLAAAALLAVDPLYLVQSRTLEAEMPSLALMLLGIALAVEAARRDRRAWRNWLIAASGVLLGLAVMVKVLAIVGVVPTALVFIWPGLLLHPERKRISRGTLRMRGGRALWAELRAAWPGLGLLLTGFAGACALVLLPFIGSLGAVYQQVVGVYLGAAHIFGPAPLSNLRAMLSLGGEYWLFGAAAVAVIVAIWRRSPLVLLVAAWGLATLVALLQQPTPWPRHAVFLVPPLVLLAALLLRLAPPLPAARAARRLPATDRLRAALRQPTIATYGALILLGATFAIGLIISVVEDERALSYSASNAVGGQVLISYTLAGAVPSGDVVVTDDPYLAGLVGLRLPPELIDTSLVRIETGNLTAKQLETVITRDDVRAVLFSSGRFDRVPGFRGWVTHNFEARKDFGGGRILYVKGAQGPVSA
jgi:4-amino-4-deoxy-L-arabinose transferase-like glycosyltransferase